ncbi:MAG: 16S rRNA (adenine1518-N6/adenine1519-N6)-dimethyltransferase [Chlamydiales bacterium]|jgi:16S rRNA (adenine1518-N6/adenine1519-N6)-dimethyltransferase
MKMFKPSDLQEFLQSLGVHAKKALSQNFLIDGNIINKMVKTANLTDDDVVLEIGPGPGALTQALLAAGSTVLAVEKDNIFSAALPRLDEGGNRLKVYNDDIMTFPIEQRLSELLKPGQKAKVVANLPYHLTTPILSKLIRLGDCISYIQVMVQEEVGRRMAAKPGNKEYGSLTVYLAYYTQVSYAFGVSRNCFHPKPKVDSAVVCLQPREKPSVSSEERFFLLTRGAFGQRRKALRSSLRKLYPPELVENALKCMGKKPLTRPEELSLSDFVQLFTLCENPL